MLNVLRDNLKHLKWLLLVVAASLLLYLGLYFDRGADGSSQAWAARVDGEAIPIAEFLETARRQDDFYRRILGAQYEQMRKQIQMGSQVLQSLVDQRILFAEARKMGLEATPEEISQRILNDPSFRDPAGNFVGKERYTQAVNASFGGGVVAYEREIAREIAIEKWMNLMTESATVSDAELERLYRSRNEKAAVDYVLVGGAAQNFNATVSDADIASWYEGNKDRYRRGEARKVRFVVVERQPQVAKVTVSDDEVRALYDANRAQYERPEQRRVRQILFRVPGAGTDEDRRSVRNLAESVRKRLEGGEDFAALARAMSQDPPSAERGGDMGFVSREDLEPEMASAVFATTPGAFAPVVESATGVHVVQVTESRPAGTVPFDEVREVLKRQIELRKAQERVETEAQRLRAALNSPGDLDAVAAKEGLKVEERVLARDDRALDLGASPEFWTSVFNLAPGQVSPPLALARGMALATVAEILPPATRPLDEVRDAVRGDILAERARLAAKAAARRALDAGKDLDGAARILKAEVKRSGDLAPGQAVPGVGRVPALEEAIFGATAAVGSEGLVEAPGGAMLYKITRHDAFDRARFEAGKAQLRDELIRARRAAMVQSILEGLRQRRAIEVNQELVQQVNG